MDISGEHTTMTLIGCTFLSNTAGEHPLPSNLKVQAVVEFFASPHFLRFIQVLRSVVEGHCSWHLIMEISTQSCARIVTSRKTSQTMTVHTPSFLRLCTSIMTVKLPNVFLVSHVSRGSDVLQPDRPDAFHDGRKQRVFVKHC